MLALNNFIVLIGLGYAVAQYLPVPIGESGAMERYPGFYGQQGVMFIADGNAAVIRGQGLTTNQIDGIYGHNFGQVMTDIQTVPVRNQYEPSQPVVIESNELNPIVVNFGSHSSDLIPIQIHERREATVQRIQTIEEPHHLIHEVIRPIIQEIREIILPKRRVIQEVHPIEEDIQTIVASGEGGPQAQIKAGIAGESVNYQTGGTSQQISRVLTSV